MTMDHHNHIGDYYLNLSVIYSRLGWKEKAQWARKIAMGYFGF